MKKIFILLLLLMMNSCRYISCNKTDSNEMDSLMLNVQLRHILHEYMVTYPQYKNVAIYTDLLDTWNYKTNNTYFSIEPLLYYDFVSVSGRNRGCPYYYVKIDEYKFFFLSRMDNLLEDKQTRQIVKNNSLKNVVYLRGEKGWFVEVDSVNHYHILTKHCAGFYFSTMPVIKMTKKLFVKDKK